MTREDVELPEPEDARQVRFFQEGEWALLRACLDPEVHDLVDLLFSTGARWGEASAITARAVTFPDPLPGDDGCRATIEVSRAWARRAKEDKSHIRSEAYENRTWKLGPPKNKTVRYLVLTGAMAARLRDRVAMLAPEDYVFTTPGGRPWRYADFYTDRWKPGREEAAGRGLTKHATIHMLRHSAAVHALARGVPVYKVSRMLGHREPSPPSGSTAGWSTSGTPPWLTRIGKHVHFTPEHLAQIVAAREGPAAATPRRNMRDDTGSDLVA